MAETWVVDASPLLSLAKIGRVDLLVDRGRRVLVPSAVADEINSGPIDDSTRKALEAGFDLEVRSVVADGDVLEWGLGSGESAVLSLSRATQSLAILDDREARAAARTLGMRVSGTLGVVVQAARAGKIVAAGPIVRALRVAGLRLSDRAVADALAKYLGETWTP